MKIAHIVVAVAAALPIPEVSAQPAAPIGGQQATSLVDAEVRKIDTEQGKVTLRHGPLPNLDMPGMTMVFRVTDPRMLDALKVGDKVRFSADRIDGAFTVTSIQAAN